jgi:hypothetical protein
MCKRNVIFGYSILLWMILIGIMQPLGMVTNEFHPRSLESFPSPAQSQGYNTTLADQFSGTRALELCETQVNFGYRIPGSDASFNCWSWIYNELSVYGDPVAHNFTYFGVECRNLLLKINPGHQNIVAFGAHWDSRAKADADPNPALRDQAVTGANDGASGVAIMLEMIRILHSTSLSFNSEFWFFFFDAEDQGELFYPQWSWIAGSTQFVADMVAMPNLYFSPGQNFSNIRAFILFDMVGGANLQFIREGFSHPNLQNDFFTLGRNLGYTDVFPASGSITAITDDHVPFRNQGVPTLDLIIKFWDRSSTSRWPYHHTTGDTIDHLDANSLYITGRTALQYLVNTYSENAITTPPSYSSYTSSPNLLWDWRLDPTQKAVIIGLMAVLVFIMWRLRKRDIEDRSINENEIKLDTDPTNLPNLDDTQKEEILNRLNTKSGLN